MRTSRFGFAGAALGLLLLACNRDLTVNVLSELGEAPIAGVRVQLDDRPWEITGRAGEVLFKGVGPSFVLRVHQVTSGSDFRFDDVWVLQSPEGDPVEILADGSGVDRHTSNVSGSVVGGTGGAVRVYAATFLRAPMVWTQAAGDGAFALDVSWEGITAQPATIHALELGGTRPVHYQAYGKREVIVSDPGGTGGSTSTSVTLVRVNEIEVSASVAVPPELAGATVQASTALQLTAGTMWLEGSEVTGPSLTAVFPEVTGMPGWLELRAVESQVPFSAWSSHSQRVSLPFGGVMGFDLPAPVTLVEPEDGAAIDASTVFRWTGGPSGGRNALLLTCEWTDAGGAARNFNFRNIEVTGTEASLPALTDLPIEAGAACQWSVAWYPADSHLGATGAERFVPERRYSISRSRIATFQ